MAVLKLENTDF